MVWRA